MKAIAVIFLSALLLAQSPQVLLAGDDPLIGEWVSTTRSKGGLGGSRYFKNDGTVIVTIGALIDFKYKITENILQLYDETGALVTSQEFKISGSDLLLHEIKTGKEQKLTRVQGDPLPNILGKWVGDHYTGGKQCMHFTQGLNCYFSVPFGQAKGTYKVNGETYIEESPEKGKTEWKISIKDDLLTLTKKDGSKIEEYKKKK
jgi:hypothetical protein